MNFDKSKFYKTRSGQPVIIDKVKKSIYGRFLKKGGRLRASQDWIETKWGLNRLNENSKLMLMPHDMPKPADIWYLFDEDEPYYVVRKVADRQYTVRKIIPRTPIALIEPPFRDIPLHYFDTIHYRIGKQGHKPQTIDP